MHMAAADSPYWNLNFSNGKFPKTTTVGAYTGDPIPEGLYKKVETGKAWSVAPIGNIYAAFSPSHTRTDNPVANAFSSPFFTVDSETAILRWEGRSILPGFPEAYTVGYRTEEGGSLTTLFSTDVEDTRWMPHKVDLGFLNGQNVQIEFTCTSTNQYLLGLTNIWAGVPTDVILTAIDRSKRFLANGQLATARFELVSTGAVPHGMFAFIVSDARGMDTDSQTIALEWPDSDRVELDFNFNPEPDAKGGYKLCYVDEDNVTVVAEGNYWSSTFERTLLVDEATGMWCNTCPQGNLELQNLETLFGDQLAVVATHVATSNNDLFDQPDYWANLHWYDIYRLMADRNQSTAGKQTAGFEAAYGAPVTAEIKVSECELTSAGEANVKVSLRFAESLQDASDKYGVGYVVTSDFRRYDVNPRYYQENSLVIPTYQQYQFLPSKIPSDLAVFSNVNIENTYGFVPMEGSVPSSVEAGQEYLYGFSVPLPELAPDWEGCNLVAFILDLESGHVANSTKFAMRDFIHSGFNPGMLPGSLATLCGNTLTIGGSVEGAVIRISDACGRLLGSHTVHAGQVISLDGTQGFRIVTIDAPMGRQTFKILK